MTKFARVVVGFNWSLLLIGMFIAMLKPEWVKNPEMIILSFTSCIFVTAAWWEDLK